MTIQHIFEAFESIGCCTFSTIENGFPQSRIAHFIAYDEHGLYFSTMYTKPFYKQLKENKSISVCGMNASPNIEAIDEETIVFEAGYFIRITGEAEEIPLSILQEKKNPLFTYFLADQARYPAMVCFLIRDFHGEIYDYDFEKLSRPNKLNRTRFSFGSLKAPSIGFKILDTCINCGACIEKCSFLALSVGKTKPIQIRNRCDECGDCVLVCPVKAVVHKGI